MSNLKVAIVQTQQFWEDKTTNLTHFDALLKTQLKASIDVLVFPEMFHTGFTMSASKLAENMSNSSGIEWLRSKSIELDCLCIASLIVEQDNQYYNRMVAIHPNGQIDHYDKIHLFSLAKEDEYYTPGISKTIVNFRGWKLLLQVCYDLRFPENSRNTAQKNGEFDFDALIYIANWPERRISHWNALLPARSIENQCYTIAVNRIGNDNNDLHYNGSSQIIDAMGDYVLKPVYDKEKVSTHLLSIDSLHETRRKLAFLKDRKLKLSN